MTQIKRLKADIAATDVTLESLRAKRDELDEKVEAIRASIANVHGERQKLVDQLIAAQERILDEAGFF